MTVLGQCDYGLRFDWGLQGLAAIAPGAQVIVLVDVLSFTTSVDIAVGRGAAVYPCGWRDGSAVDIATRVGGVVGTLSPSKRLDVTAGTRLVVESVNGSALAHATSTRVPVYAACLRNAAAIANAVREFETVAIVAAGERWGDGSLRPALEDLLGAGAVIASLAGIRSPEATVAAASFQHHAARLRATLSACASGREKIARNEAADIDLAAALNVSAAAPQLIDGAFREIGDS